MKEHVIKFEAEVTSSIVLDTGVTEVRFEITGDKEAGISGNGIVRAKEGLIFEPEQRLYLQFKPGAKIKKGMGQKGVMDLSKMLETKNEEGE